MIIEKTAMKAIGSLAGFQSDCRKCGQRTRIVRSIAPSFSMGGGEEIYGGRCGPCGTILWSEDSYNSILIQRYGDPPVGVDRKAFRESIIRKFLASLPACPTCGGEEHVEFIGQEMPDSPECGTCHAALPPFLGYVREMLDDTVFLVHETEDAALKSQKMRYSFVHWDRLI